MPLTTDMIVDALRSLNREATAPDILEEIKKLYRDETLGKTPVNSIRARLQEACPETGQYKGRRSLFRRVSPVKERKGVWSLRNDSLSPVASNMINDQEDILNNKILSETERQALVQGRIGQDRFRQELFKRWGAACAVTNIEIPELLRASHIKSWSESNPEERLDADNGLLLIANIDAAFDRHLISFEDNGVMLFSKELGDDPCQTLGISQGASIRYDLNENQKKYLRQHREKLRK